MVGEWVFILVGVLLLGWHNVRGLWQPILNGATWGWPLTWREVGGKNLLILFALLYAWAAVLIVVRRRWLKIGSYVIILALFGVDLFLYANFGYGINTVTLTLPFETNPTEVKGFIDTFALSWPSLLTLSIITVAIVATVWLERLGRARSWVIKSPVKRLAAVVVLLLMLIIGVVSMTPMVHLLAAKDSNHFDRSLGGLKDLVHVGYQGPLFSLAFALKSLQLQARETQGWLQMNEQLACTSPTPPILSDSTVIVYVIGESHKKNRSSLYGYALDTNPRLCREESEGRLVKFTDWVAPYYFTSGVMHYLLTVSQRTGRDWLKSPHLALLFTKAGWQVTYDDAQTPYTPTQESESMYDVNVKSLFNNPLLLAEAYSRQPTANIYEYDLPFLDEVLPKPRPAIGPYLQILHLRGQHIPYKHTAEFNHFKPSDYACTQWARTPEALKVMADYDNCTLQNDSALSRIIDRWRGSEAVIVYVSDHAEEVFDYRTSYGRLEVSEDLVPQQVHTLCEVPMWIWVSDNYEAKHPGTRQRLRAVAQKPGYSSDLTQTLIGLAGIESPYYNAEADILSPLYTPPRRQVLERYDYDALMKKLSRN